jgi:predicted secreted Zn-dependent protease
MTTQFGDVERASYNVSGATLRDVAGAIAHLPEAGSTEWFPHYDYNSDERGAVTEVSVRVGWRVTLPNWDGYHGACQPERDEWDRFLTALDAHEQGHIDVAIGHLSGLDEHMLGGSAHQAGVIFEQALQQLQAASNAYDQSTDHGRNTGTIIDVGVATRAIGAAE